jgi:hypothetical protein
MLVQTLEQFKNLIVGHFSSDQWLCLNYKGRHNAKAVYLEFC